MPGPGMNPKTPKPQRPIPGPTKYLWAALADSHPRFSIFDLTLRFHSGSLPMIRALLPRAPDPLPTIRNSFPRRQFIKGLESQKLRSQIHRKVTQEKLHSIQLDLYSQSRRLAHVFYLQLSATPLLPAGDAHPYLKGHVQSRE